MTLAQFDALLDRFLEADQRATLRVGTIAAAVYNANPFRPSDAKAVSPLDFLSPRDRRRFEPDQTLEEQIEQFTAIFGCGPGKVKN